MKFDPVIFILVVLGGPLLGLRVMIGSRGSKVAVISWLIVPDAWPTVTVHVRVEPEQSPPLQPPNEDPLDGVAVRVTVLALVWVSSRSYDFAQSPV